MSTRVLFLFRRNRLEQLQAWRNGNAPADFLYGLPFIDSNGIVCEFVEGDDTSDDWRRRICYPFESVISRVVGIGFSLHIVWIHWKRIRRASILVSTVDTCGLPIAMLKWLGILRAPVIYISQGLAHRLLMRVPSGCAWLVRLAYSRFLQSVERVLVLGEGAAAPVEREFCVDPARVSILPFGVDDRYWMPTENHSQGDYILSIGTDAARDYPTLLSAAVHRKLHIVTRQCLSASLLGSEVHVSSNHSFAQLRGLYRAARFVVIPLQDVDQPSGQSAALQAMACGKAVILTRTRGLWEAAHMRHMETCYLVDPGDVDNLRNGIDYLWTNPREAERIGLNGRRLVEHRYNARALAQNLRRHVLEVVEVAG